MLRAFREAGNPRRPSNERFLLGGTARGRQAARWPVARWPGARVGACRATAPPPGYRGRRRRPCAPTGSVGNSPARCACANSAAALLARPPAHVTTAALPRGPRKARARGASRRRGAWTILLIAPWHVLRASARSPRRHKEGKGVDQRVHAPLTAPAFFPGARGPAPSSKRLVQRGSAPRLLRRAFGSGLGLAAVDWRCLAAGPGLAWPCRVAKASHTCNRAIHPPPPPPPHHHLHYHHHHHHHFTDHNSVQIQIQVQIQIHAYHIISSRHPRFERGSCLDRVRVRFPPPQATAPTTSTKHATPHLRRHCAQTPTPTPTPTPTLP